MATIRSRGSKFHVQVRKIGYPTVTKTFSSISVAKQWAKITEADMERQLHVVIPDNTTVGELLDRYETEIVPTRKGHRVEAYKVRTQLQPSVDVRAFTLTCMYVVRIFWTRLPNC